MATSSGCYAGSVCFPRIPLMRISGPLIVVQLLETTFLTLVNYASLITTNAARYITGLKYFSPFET
jgi:nicotinic acid phosphoribosyltransferase